MYDNLFFACRINIDSCTLSIPSIFNDIFSFVADFDAESLDFALMRKLWNPSQRVRYSGTRAEITLCKRMLMLIRMWWTGGNGRISAQNLNRPRLAESALHEMRGLLVNLWFTENVTRSIYSEKGIILVKEDNSFPDCDSCRKCDILTRWHMDMCFNIFS